MNFGKQKVFIVVFGTALALGLVVLGYIFWQKGGFKLVEKRLSKKVEIKSDFKEVKSKPAKKELSRFLKLAETPVLGLRLFPGTNKVLFYQAQKFFTVDPYSGERKSVGAYPFTEVQKFVWDLSGNKAIVKDLGEYYIFDFRSNLTKKFPDKIDIAIWNRQGDKVIYKNYNTQTHQRQIKVADTDGNNKMVAVDNLPYRRIEMTLQPRTDRFCYFPSPDARVKGRLFCQNLDGSNLQEWGGNYGQDYLWSPAGEKILTSFAKDETGSQLVLGVMNKNGGEFHGLAFPTTVRKCVWSKDGVNVYCALLGNIPTVVMLPNFWQEKSFDSVDTFWKINTETGKKSRLVEVEKMKQGDKELLFDTTNLLLDPEEEFLFFIDRRQGDLWRIKIK